MRRVLAGCVVLAAAVAAEAQGPPAKWQTLSTPHFRIHYPKEYEAWTHRAASRLESIRAAVVREVGYNAPTPIDVLIMNPIAQPNALAWPLLDTPRIVFFTEPPGPDEQIGAYSSWIDLVAVHEVAHIVHMSRPSRNPLSHVLERFVLPLNRVSLGAPRWVLEGYATVIEGRLTGSGRPPGTMRALILRTWAAEGRMPPYDLLDNDARFLGMSMAYLAGSAYLEWLEQRSGPESLRNLWTRMTARQGRSFEEAFTGVFGESPQRLYGQFVAELTASAVAANRAAPMREGELWQQTSRGSGDPALSPDGKLLAFVSRPRSKPSALLVWSTGPAEQEEKRYAERLAKIRERDPEDVAPVRSKPLARDPIHSFSSPDGGDLLTPRWTADGRSILYSHRQPDAEGFLHHDLFLWTPETGTNRRVTHLADVSDADPLPDGGRAVALRSRFGFSQLVIVDLASGDVAPLTEPSLDIVYSHPRAERSGNRVAYVANRSGGWSLVIRDLDTGAEWAVAPAAGDAFASPEWMPGRDEIVATILSRGFAELYRVGPGGTRFPITRTSGGAMQPAPAADGRVFFMSLQPDGFVLRVIDGAAAAPAPLLDESLVPAIPPRPGASSAFAAQNLPSPKPYGAGRQEISWIVSQNLAPSQSATEIGMRIGDVVGRLDTIAVASFGSEDAQRGVAVASAWRGWPVEVAAHLFRAEDRREDRSGAELRAMWTRAAPRTSVAIEGGVLGGSLDHGFVESRFRAFRVARGLWVDSELALGYDWGSFQQRRGSISAGIRRGGFGLTAKFDRRVLDGDGDAIELGGLPSTIIPRSAFINRVFDPAVPVAAMAGNDYEGRRVEATLPGLPLSLFYQQHRMSGVDVEVAGGEIVIAAEPVPILHLPALDLTAGVARILSGPAVREGVVGDTNWWLGLRWRP